MKIQLRHLPLSSVNLKPCPHSCGFKIPMVVGAAVDREEKTRNEAPCERVLVRVLRGPQKGAIPTTAARQFQRHFH